MPNERVSPQLLGLVRIAVFGFWLANVSLVHLEDVAAMPFELLERYGVLWLIPPPVWALLWTGPALFVLKAGLVVALVWLILGLPRFGAVAIATCIGLTLFDGMEKSLGHINHSKMLMLYSAWVLAMFPSADGLSLSPRRGPPPHPVMYTAPVVAISLLIVMAYSMIGAFRIGRSGPGIFFGDAMKNWFLKRSYESTSTDFRLGITIAEHAWLLLGVKLGFFVTGMLELLSPLCLVSRWFRWVWIPTMIVFHFVSLLTMNISFWQNSILILLVMTDLDRVVGPRLGWRPPPEPERPAGAPEAAPAPS